MTRSRRGFTIVELLAVVAITSVMVAMLLPTVKSARDAAQTTECMSNLQLVGLGGAGYVIDNNGYVPPYGRYTADNPGEELLFDMIAHEPAAPSGYRRMYLLTTWFLSGPYSSWPRAADGYLSPYMGLGAGVDSMALSDDGTYGGLDTLLGCPSEPMGPTPKMLTHPSVPVPMEALVDRTRSYALNLGNTSHYDGLIDPDEDYAGRRFSSLSPQMVFMGDGPGEEPFIFGPRFHEWADITLFTPDLRHEGTFNAVVLDGHVENGTLETLWIDEFWFTEE